MASSESFITNYLRKRITWLLVFCISIIFKWHIALQMSALLILIAGFDTLENIFSGFLTRLFAADEISYKDLKIILSKPEQVGQPSLLKEHVGPISQKSLSTKILVYAVKALNAGNFRAAITLGEGAILIDKENYDVNTFLGFMYDLAGVSQPEKAVEYCRRALSLRPRSFLPQFNLAVATNHYYDSTKSLSEFLEAEKYAEENRIDPNSEVIGKLNLFMAEDYKKLGESAKSEERYKKAESILSKLAERGDKTSQHWLDATRGRLSELAAVK